eukprot:963223_1
MGCLFYNSPSVQYRWCLAGVSPAPCPNYTTHYAQQYIQHCHPWVNIYFNGTMHHILGFTPSNLLLPPIASDCHTHIQYDSQRTLEQVDYIIHLLLDSAMQYIPFSIVFCIFYTSYSLFLDRPMWMVSGRTIETDETDERTKYLPPTASSFAPNSTAISRHYLIIYHPNPSTQHVSSWVVHWMDSIQWYLEQSPATSLLCLAYLNVCLSECVKVAIYLRLTYSIIRITNPYSKKKK